MARFRFGKKKRESDPDSSMVTSESVDDSPTYHLYLRRPSILSRNQVETPPHESLDNLPTQEPEVADPTATTPWKRFKIFDSPFPRYRHAASAISSDKNEIFLMGGLKEGSVFGDTWKVTPEVGAGNIIRGFTAQHLEVANSTLPPARVGHSSVLCGNAFIIYGGDTVDTDYNGYPDDNFYMFNINNYKYTIPLHVLSKPRGRYGHLIGVASLSATSSRLYLFGGQLENDVFNDLYYFELTNFKLPKARWELVEPLNNFKPPPVTNHTMSIYKNKIYIFGGVYNNEKVCNDLWCFDTLINKWVQVPTTGDVPLPVNEHSATIVGDRLYVYGGNDFSGAIYETLYSLDLHTFKWSKLSKDLSANGPGPRCGHSMSYIPKLNQLIIMGGDKNDFIYSDPENFETYENFDGQELGTMIYALDIPTADHFFRGGAPKKLAASAGGAAGVLNRRAPSPLPSEDGLARHRKSLSGGIEDFRTPNASMEKFPRSLDPKSTLIENEVEQETTTPERFVDVDIPSSAAMSEKDVTTEMEDIRDRYIAGDNAEEAAPSTYHNGHAPLFRNDSAEKLRTDTATPILTRDFAHLSDSVDDEDDRARDESFVLQVPTNSSPTSNKVVFTGLGGAVGASAGIGAANAISDEKTENPTLSNGRSSRITHTNQGANEADAKVKKIIAELNAELTQLKSSTKQQMQNATEKIQALEQQNKELQANNALAANEKLNLLTNQVQEKDNLIEELRRSVDPQDLEIGEGEETGSIATSKRGFTELTKYKLNRLEMSNRMVYLENENANLKEKFARFEPFMNNQISEISTLQKVIKGQEDRIQKLTAQVKLESVLHQQISEWKHKFENLDLEFQNYRAIHDEVEVSDDEELATRELDGDASIATSGTTRRSTRQISSQLENLVLLWQSTNATDADTRLINTVDNPVVAQLQKQVDELLLSSKKQQEGASAEVQTLESELQAKLLSLRTFEDNYRDALQSVNNTSKALNLTQDELKSQKILIEKLIKENNELKLYKKASAVSKRASSAVSTPVNESSPGFANPALEAEEEEEGFTSAHYNMKLKDLEADLYILKQERDQLTDTVSSLKKDLYLARNGNA